MEIELDIDTSKAEKKLIELDTVRKELGLMTTSEFGHWLFVLVFGLLVGFLLGVSYE